MRIQEKNSQKISTVFELLKIEWYMLQMLKLMSQGCFFNISVFGVFYNTENNKVFIGFPFS